MQVRTRKGNQFLSIAGHIRNALAHGRVAASQRDGEWMLYFEDVKRSKGSCCTRARMAIKLSTLRRWVEIMDGVPQGA